MGFKCKFPRALWSPVPGSSQESVGRVRALGVVSGDCRLCWPRKAQMAIFLEHHHWACGGVQVLLTLLSLRPSHYS